MRKMFYRNIDSADQESGGSPLDDLSSEITLDELPTSLLDTPIESPTEDEPKDKEGNEDSDFKLPEEKEEDAPLEKEKEETKEEDTEKEKDEKKEEDAPKDEVIDPFDKVIKETEKTEEKSLINWADLAKEDGIEAASKEEYVTKIKEKAKIDIQKELTALPEEGLMFIEHIKAGGSIDDFKEPLRQYDEVLGMDDIDLVELDLKNTPGWTDEMVATEIENLVEKGQVEHHAAKIRAYVNVQKENEKKNIFETQQAAAAQKEQAAVMQKEAEIKGIQEVLGKTEEFMGTKLKQEHKDFIERQYKKGNFEKVTNNVAEQVEFMLYKTFGKQGIESIKNDAYERGMDEIRKTLHKAPSKPEESGGRRKNTITTEVENDFASIPDDFDQ
jgi:hypothetical protein